MVADNHLYTFYQADEDYDQALMEVIEHEARTRSLLRQAVSLEYLHLVDPSNTVFKAFFK